MVERYLSTFFVRYPLDGSAKYGVYGRTTDARVTVALLCSSTKQS